MSEENSTASPITQGSEATSDTFYVHPKQTKQQKVTSTQLLQLINERRGEECHTFIEAYGDMIVQAVQQVVPTFSERVIIRKLEHYFVSNSQRPHTGKQLADEIIRTVEDLRDDFLRLRALKQLMSEKQKHLHQVYVKQRKGVPQLSYTQSDVLDRINLLQQDAQRMSETLMSKLGHTSIDEWFTLHTTNAQTITARNHKLLTLSDLPPILLHDFGQHQLVELYTADQLAKEGDDMTHCVGGASTWDAVRSGKMKVRSIRTAEGTSRYTVGYDPIGQKIVQRKGKANKDLVTKTKPDFAQMCAMLGRLKTTYPVTTVADWDGVCDQDKELLRDDGTITDQTSTTIISHILAGRQPLLGDIGILELSASLSSSDVHTICAIPGLILDLTQLSPATKSTITHIAGSMVDKSRGNVVYSKLTTLGRHAEIFSAGDVQLPVLEHVGIGIYTRDSAIQPNPNTHQLEHIARPGGLVQAQTALRAQRADERLPDGRSMYDVLDTLMQDPNFVRLGVDEYGDTYTEFVEAKVQCRHAYLRTDGMQAGEYENGKNDYNQYTDTQLMSTTTSSASKDCIYKNTIDQQKPARKKQMDTDCYAKGYKRQTKAETDAILSSLAQRLGITYNPNSTSDQQVVKAYMYLKGALGRERYNTQYKTGKNGDKYGMINGKHIDSRSVLFCHVDLLSLIWGDGVDNFCSVSLSRG